MEADYLDVFDLLLKGGLAGGSWVFLGDFELQAIYMSEGGAGAQQALETLSERSPSHVQLLATHQIAGTPNRLRTPLRLPAA